VYGCSRAEQDGWGSATVIGLLALGVALLVSFGLVENRVQNPLLPLRIIMDRTRGSSYLAVGLAVFGMFAMFLFLTYYLQIVKDYSPVRTGCAFGAFLGYLSSAQQILQEQYSVGPRFPLYFATLALSLGSASFLNARLVMRHGMRTLSVLASTTLCSLAILFGGAVAVWHGQPPLWALMTYLLLSFFCVGPLFGNLNALAMQPLGRVAGTGAAVVGGLATLISLLLGTIIGQSYNGTVIPLVSGFAMLGALTVAAMCWAESGSGAVSGPAGIADEPLILGD